MKLSSLLSLVSFFVLSFCSAALASQACLAFDAQWNLLVFGFGEKDYNVGPQSAWLSPGSPTDITSSGRPPFNGKNVTCYLSQFTNAIYVLGADAADLAAIYIYDATAKSWSKQGVTAGKFDPSSFVAILDHDTNVFYALSGGEIFSLDMALLKSADSKAIPWNEVQRPTFAANGYQPVMALAQNHIHFLNVPGLQPGQAQIFVIHFSYVQPEVQLYSGPAFPAVHGQATSFFKEQGVQQEFAFIPDDGSAAYVINVETNSTQTLQPPSLKDAGATYVASITALVQLGSDYSVSFIPYDVTSAAANRAASWSAVSKLSKPEKNNTPSRTLTSTNPKSTSTSKTDNNSNGAYSKHVSVLVFTVGLVGLLGSFV